ncbi:MAG: AmmeMemoRadiSam system radical SAM enzyme [Spirochaetes bacterium]|nr:AmmeMemoRadiSam system radical SAM enzyme [Spirochaetota bacterium]
MTETFSWLADYSGDVPRCLLCPHLCRIREGADGICGVRTNHNGKIHSLIYGKVSAVAMDPVEKKPLYHFHPGEQILSLGSIGCNFKCPFCQNYHISQKPFPPTEELSIADLVREAKRSARMVAFTYAEPLVWYEYVYDAAQALRQEGIDTVLVTNGFIDEAPLMKLLPYISAMNIDIKGDDAFYKQSAKGVADDVRRTIRLSAPVCHVELTTLLVPGLNDRDDVIDGIGSFIASVNRNIPWHISAYRPAYRYTALPMPEERLIGFVRRARERVQYVYTGNILSDECNTCCPQCGHILIERQGYLTTVTGFDGIKCRHCGLELKGDFVL